MKKYQAGTSMDLAEIIIDYSKKKVRLINPETNKNFKVNYFLNFDFIYIHLIALIVILLFTFAYFLHARIISEGFVMLFGVYLTFTCITILSQPLKHKFHYTNQKLLNDFFKLKKVIIKKELNDKVFVVENFSNIKLDYKLTKDFSKYIHKIHIKPRDFYYRRKNKLVKQLEEWDAYFYFTNIPKKGKMEIEFI